MSKGEILTAYISYFDEESALYYLQMSHFHKVEALTTSINEFYDDEKNLKSYTKIDVEYFKKNFFCARYHLDNKWSRAKVLKERGTDKV